ncbi:MAG: SCP2 sterol-binding domain-containing protein [Lachnospiraceae bacterium]|nr:SCP2 sterol-binding domain-containing protein [Lachnospiraceae bacterium]
MEKDKMLKQDVDQVEEKITFEELFPQIKEKLEQQDAVTVPGRVAFEFHITDLKGVFYVEADNGKVDVEPYDYYDKNGVFTASAATYKALCDGSLTPVTAFAAGRLKVNGEVDLVRTLEALFSGKQKQYHLR